MTQMIRKQIYIHKRQEALLKRQARLRKESEAGLIREAIDHALQGTSTPRPFRRDPEAWDKMQRFMLSRRAHATTPAQPYRWNREEAYADRNRRRGPQTKQRTPKLKS